MRYHRRTCPGLSHCGVGRISVCMRGVDCEGHEHQSNSASQKKAVLNLNQSTARVTDLRRKRVYEASRTRPTSQVDSKSFRRKMSVQTSSLNESSNLRM